MIEIAEVLPTTPSPLWKLAKQAGVDYVVGALPFGEEFLARDEEFHRAEQPWDYLPLLRAQQRYHDAGFKEVVIESRGEPKVVMLSYGEYQEFLALKEQARRKEALRQLEELAARMQTRNADMSAEEVEQLADEITRETIQRMEMEGKITFQS